MKNGGNVMAMLMPAGGWTIYGDDFDSIIYDEGVQPLTKKQFDDGFAQYDAWKAEQDALKAANKNALLNRLGISEDEAKLLLA